MLNCVDRRYKMLVNNDTTIALTNYTQGSTIESSCAANR